jgi:hypothetical protein
MTSSLIRQPISSSRGHPRDPDCISMITEKKLKIIELVAKIMSGVLVALTLFLLYFDQALPLSLYLGLWGFINQFPTEIPAFLIGVSYLFVIALLFFALYFRKKVKSFVSRRGLFALLVFLVVLGVYATNLAWNHFCPLKCSFLAERSGLSQEVRARDMGKCDASQQIIWDDVHGLYGGSRISVCGNEILVVTVGLEERSVRAGILSQVEVEKLYLLAANVSRSSVGPRADRVPDSSEIKLYLAQDGSEHSYRVDYNNRGPAVQELGSALERIVARLAVISREI